MVMIILAHLISVAPVIVPVPPRNKILVKQGSEGVTEIYWTRAPLFSSRCMVHVVFICKMAEWRRV